MRRTNGEPGRPTTRRGFLASSLAAAAALTIGARAAAVSGLPAASREFKISLAAWSLHRAFFSNLLKLIDFPTVARRTFGIGAVELVNSFFPSPQARFLEELKTRASGQGVEILLIMVDGEGDLGHSDSQQRRLAVRNHFKWLDIAQQLGCHSIRVNMRFDDEDPSASGISDSQLQRALESFQRLVEYAEPANLSVLIENHGGLSSNADALVEVMQAVNSPRFGTLPDFGNFPPGTDKYESIRKMMPFAQAVSAKCYDFGEDGNETALDYEKMLQIVVDQAGYHGHIGIEYEGTRLSEYEGISRCKALLERLRGA